LATNLAILATRRRWLAIAYVAGAFIVVPLIGIVVLT
jgi:hypothetical protein